MLDDAADVGRGKMGLGVWLVPAACLLTDEERESDDMACAIGRGLTSGVGAGSGAEAGTATSVTGGGEGSRGAAGGSTLQQLFVVGDPETVCSGEQISIISVSAWLTDDVDEYPVSNRGLDVCPSTEVWAATPGE